MLDDCVIGIERFDLYVPDKHMTLSPSLMHVHTSKTGSLCSRARGVPFIHVHADSIVRVQQVLHVRLHGGEIGLCVLCLLRFFTCEIMGYDKPDFHLLLVT